MNKNLIEIAKIMYEKFNSELSITENDNTNQPILFDTTTIRDNQFEINIKTNKITGELIEGKVLSDRSITNKFCPPGRKRSEGIVEFVPLMKFKNIKELEDNIQTSVEKFMLENETYRIATGNLLWLRYGNLFSMMEGVNVEWSKHEIIHPINNNYIIRLKTDKVSVDILLYLDSTQIREQIEKFKEKIKREENFENMINKKRLFGWF